MAVAAGYWSGSKHIASAAAVVGLLWLGSVLLYFLGGGETPAWHYATIDLVALIYFYRRWSAPNPQHRHFHFLLMCSYLITTAFYSYQVALLRYAPEALLMSGWWFELFSNILYEAELVGITIYSVLFRRAKMDRRRFQSDVDRWFDGMSALRQTIAGGGARRRARTDEPWR